MNKNTHTLNELEVTNDYLDFHSRYYSFSRIDSLPNTKLVSYSPQTFDLINLEKAEANNKQLIELLNGEFLLKNSKPYSMVYAGHQFGYFVPELGDGRAINLGCVNGWHLQLKGSGLTKYSRQGDGKAVLRSSIREYLMSEAMHGLNIPTTRALAIINSDEPVFREEVETASIVLRLSKSWVRIGTFEYFYQSKDLQSLKELADFVIKENFEHLISQENKYEKLFFEIVDKTAYLIALWQAYGFMHGVMNTDNMSVAGFTIDYGPYAFMDNFDANNICNHTDHEGRYSYANQPHIAQWNLDSLATCFSAFADEKKLMDYLDGFLHMQDNEYLKIMQKKLGLGDELSSNSNRDLITQLIGTLSTCNIDYTLFFNHLSSFKFEEIIELCMYKNPMQEWLDSYKMVLEKQTLSKDEISKKMKTVNPKYVLKNYMIQEAIQKAQKGDFSLVNDLLKIAQNPFIEHKGFERYMLSTPQEFCNIQLSCSS